MQASDYIPVTLAYWDHLRSHFRMAKAAHCFKDRVRKSRHA